MLENKQTNLWVTLTVSLDIMLHMHDDLPPSSKCEDL